MASKVYWVFEVLVLILGWVINQYARQRMGLYRHLYFRLSQAQEGFLAAEYQGYLIFIGVVLISIAILAIWRTEALIQTCYRFSWRGHWIMVTLLSALALALLWRFSMEQSFLMLPYFIVGIAVMAFVNGLLAIGIRYFHPADQAC